MCQNGPGSGLQHWVDFGPIAAQCGLCTWIWLTRIIYILNMLTDNSHSCDSFVTTNRSIVQSDKTRLYEKDSLSWSREYCGKRQCIAIVIPMFTRQWAWYLKSTIVIMPTLSSPWSPQVIIMATCTAPGDDKGGVMLPPGFQCNDTPNIWPMFFNTPVLSMIIFYLIYPTTVNLLVKMWYGLIFYTCHQTKLKNILISDREHMLVLRMQQVWIIVIITCVTKCSFFLIFFRTITCISIWWIHGCSASGINQSNVQRIEAAIRWPTICMPFPYPSIFFSFSDF